MSSNSTLSQGEGRAKRSFELWQEKFKARAKKAPLDSVETEKKPFTAAATEQKKPGTKTEKVKDGIKTEKARTPSKIRTSTSNTKTSKAQKQELDSYQKKLDLKRKQIKLHPFQESIEYSLLPIKTFLKTERDPGKVSLANLDKKQNHTQSISINSSAVFGESGSGLTTLIAKKAYDNYQDSKPCIILCHNDIKKQEIAQSIIDFADPQEREAIRENIDFTNDINKIGNSKKIFVVNIAKLTRYLHDNQSYRSEKQNPQSLAYFLKREKQHLPLSEIFPMDQIQEILVDEVNQYSGHGNHGYTKALNSLLYEAGQNKEINLFATTATPYQRGQNAQGKYLCQELDDLFPELSRKTSPSARELIETGYYKSPSIRKIELDDATEKALRNTDASSLLLDSGSTSINAGLVKLYQEEFKKNPQQKWHIIANSVDHAKQLCALFNLQAPAANARIMTKEAKGYFERTSDEQKTSFKLNDNDQTQFKEKRQSSEKIINDYENADCNVVIDIDHNGTFHSTKTDKVLVTHLKRGALDEKTSLRRYIGEAVKDKSKANPRQRIDYLFLSEKTMNSFGTYVNDQKKALANIEKNNTNGKGEEYEDEEAQKHNAELRLGSLRSTFSNRAWRNNGLSSIIRNRYIHSDIELSDDLIHQCLEQLAEEFQEDLSLTKKDKDPDYSLEDIKAVIAGREINKTLFKKFIRYVQYDLKQGLTEVSSYVPELTGIASAAVATKIVERAYESAFLEDQISEENTKWLTSLDQILGCPMSFNDDQKRELRSKKFAELICKKFGPQHLENRSFVNKFIRVFLGEEVDYRLFGLLVNSLAADFQKIREDFPELTGGFINLPYDVLEKKLLEKYPDGPPQDQSLDRFFREQLYDDLNIDLGSLVNAVTVHSHDSRQNIITGSTKDEIQKFIKAVYQEKSDEELSGNNDLRRSDEEMQAEVNQKTKKHLSLVTREILYNQILAKVWGINRQSYINNDDLIFSIKADELELEDQYLRDSEPERSIDLSQANAKWLCRIDDNCSPGLERIDIKKRISTSLATFLVAKYGLNHKKIQIKRTDLENNLDYNSAQSRSTTLSSSEMLETIIIKDKLNAEQERAVKVLLGSIEKPRLSDQNLLREFAKFHKMKLTEQIQDFPKLFGVMNKEEAQKIVEKRLSKLSSKNFNQDWINEFKNRNSLLASFLFDKHKNLFLDPESLDQTLNFLSGNFKDQEKVQAQNLCREFLNFAIAEGQDLERIPMVVKYYELVDLQQADEVFAAIRELRSVQAETLKSTINPNAYKFRSALGSVQFVNELAQELGKDPEELYAITEIKDPEKFYRQPLKQFRSHFGQSLNSSVEKRTEIGKELKNLLANNSATIKAKILLETTWQSEKDGYQYPTQILLPENATENRIRIKVSKNSLECREEFKNSKDSGADKDGWLEVDKQKYSFINNSWQLDETQSPAYLRHYKIAQIISQKLTENTIEDFDQNWLKRLGLIDDKNKSKIKLGDTELEKVIELIAEFIDSAFSEEHYTSMTEDNEKLKSTILMCLGQKELFKTIGEHAQVLFNDFLEWMNLKLIPRKRLTKTEHFDLKAQIYSGIYPTEKMKVKNSTFYPGDRMQIVTECPLLTGIANLEEAKAAARFAFQDLTRLGASINEEMYDNDSVYRNSLKHLAKTLGLKKDQLCDWAELPDDINGFYKEAQNKIMSKFGSVSRITSSSRQEELKALWTLSKFLPRNNVDSVRSFVQQRSDNDKKELHFYYSPNRLSAAAIDVNENLTVTELINYDYNEEKSSWHQSDIINDYDLKLINITINSLDPINDNFNLNWYSEIHKILYNNEADSYLIRLIKLISQYIEQEKPELKENPEQLIKVIFDPKNNITDNLNTYEATQNIKILIDFIKFAKTKNPKFKELQLKFPQYFLNTNLKMLELADKIKAKYSKAEANNLLKRKKSATELVSSWSNEFGFDQEEFYDFLGVPKSVEIYTPACKLIELDLKRRFNYECEIAEEAIKRQETRLRASYAINNLYGGESIAGRTFDSSTNFHIAITNDVIYARIYNTDSPHGFDNIEKLERDPKTGLWTGSYGLNIDPQNAEDLKTKLRYIFNEADINEIKANYCQHGTMSDFRKGLFNYILDITGLTEEQLVSTLGIKPGLEHYRKAAEQLLEEAEEQLKININVPIYLHELNRRMIQSSLANNVTQIFSMIWPRQLLTQNSVNVWNNPGGQLGNLNLNGDRLNLQDISYAGGPSFNVQQQRYNYDTKKWEFDPTTDIKKDLLALDENQENELWMRYFDRSIGVHQVDANIYAKAARRGSLINEFLESQHPEILVDSAVRKRAVRTIIDDPSLTIKIPNLLSEFVDFAKTRFKGFRDAELKFPELFTST